MGRDKLKRNLQFKPLCKIFGSQDYKSTETLYLLHEEMEALYLMDIKELYQADAAAEMGVSRTTFTRIIKSARQKVTMMLVSGANLIIEDEKQDFRIAVPTSSADKLIGLKPNEPYLIVYHIKDTEIISKELIENPVACEGKRPGQILPQFLIEKKINIFISSYIGEGLKGALLSKGIYSIVKDEVSEKSLVSISL